MSPHKKTPQSGLRNRPKSRSAKRAESAGSRRAPASSRRPGAQFDKLVALQERLLGPGGCPWDREQTHRSLRTYLLEEAYEVLDALDSGDHRRLAGELGDLLLQSVFHSALAQQAGLFDIGEVIERVHAKMVRRHPHVFGGARAKTAAQVLKNWEQMKSEERRAASGKSRGTSLLDGVSRTLPATLEAFQLTRRASRVGFDWADIEGLLEKLREEAAELREILAKYEPSIRAKAAAVEEEVGDLLFVAVNIARFLGVDPEIALKNANRKFIARFKQMERRAARAGRSLARTSKDDLENLWQASKKHLRDAGPKSTAATRHSAHLTVNK